MSRKKKIFFLVCILVIVYLFRVKLGIIAMNAFVFMDNLLHPSDHVPPVFMWAVLGAFIGLMYGSFVAWKKYKLDVKLNLVPAGLFILFIFLLVSINQPLSSQSAVVEAKTEDAYRLVTVRASSSLPRSKSNSYEEANMLDLNDNTAWIGNGKYAGIGDRIDFSFSATLLDSLRDLKCLGFRIKNGYNKSNKLWKDYNRMRMFYVYHNDQLVETHTASDSYNLWEQIPIKPLPIRAGDVLSIRISSVYAGKKAGAKTAITELVPVVEFREVK